MPMIHTYKCKKQERPTATGFSVRDAMLICCRGCEDIEDCNGSKLEALVFDLEAQN